MKKTLRATLLAIALGLAATVSQAVTLGFQPSAQTKFVGQTASVDVVVSGLAADNQVVSAYDFNVLYDDSILDLLSVQFSTSLGAPLDSFFDVFFDVGLVNIAEVSFLTDVDLDALQGDSVVLATLNFKGAAVGTSPLDFGNVIMDGFQQPGSSPALPVVLQPTQESGSITIIPQGGQVPEPSSLALLGVALLGYLGSRRRR